MSKKTEAGRIATQTETVQGGTPSPTVTYQYDATGQLTAVLSSDGNTTSS